MPGRKRRGDGDQAASESIKLVSYTGGQNRRGPLRISGYGHPIYPLVHTGQWQRVQSKRPRKQGLNCRSVEELLPHPVRAALNISVHEHENA